MVLGQMNANLLLNPSFWEGVLIHLSDWICMLSGDGFDVELQRFKRKKFANDRNTKPWISNH